MSYTMCPACGQHALKVANRCPRCGLPFEQQFLSRAQPPQSRRRIPIAIVLGGVLVLMLGTAEWINRRKLGPGTKPAAAAPRESVATLPEHRLPASAGLAPPADSAELGTVKTSIPAAVTPAPAPAVEVPRLPAAPSQVAASPGDRPHTATTWVNVRAQPNNASSVVGVLQPGEVVQVDSTTRGWYRVQAGRVPAGYVDRRLLEERRP